MTNMDTTIIAEIKTRYSKIMAQLDIEYFAGKYTKEQYQRLKNQFEFDEEMELMLEND